MNLDSSLEKVRGVGPKTLEQLHAAGLFAVGDILQFFPRKYEDFSALKDLSNLEPGKVLFKAKAERVSLRRVRRGMTVVDATLSDGKNKVRAVWFNQAYRVKQLQNEEELFFSGTYEFSYNRYQVTNPRVVKREALPKSETFTGEDGEIVPIYRQIRGLKTEAVRKILHMGLPRNPTYCTAVHHLLWPAVCRNYPGRFSIRCDCLCPEPWRLQR